MQNLRKTYDSITGILQKRKIRGNHRCPASACCQVDSPISLDHNEKCNLFINVKKSSIL